MQLVSHLSWKLQIINLHFTTNNKVIFTRKIPLHSKSKIHCNFSIDFIPIFRTDFVIGTLSPKFAAKWRCKRSHRVANGHYFLCLFTPFRSINAVVLELMGGGVNMSLMTPCTFMKLN